MNRSKLVIRLISGAELYDALTELCIFLACEVNQEGISHIDAYSKQ